MTTNGSNDNTNEQPDIVATPSDMLNEADDGRLWKAVQNVRADLPPSDAVERAVARAGNTIEAFTARSSTRSVSVAGKKSNGVSRQKMIAVVCVILVMAAVGHFIRVVNQDHEARRGLMANNLRQIGLATHNYYDAGAVPNAHWAMNNGQNPLPRFRSAKDQFNRPVTYAEKTVHSANMLLVVQEIRETESALGELVKTFEGEFGDSQISEPQGKPRTARWIIRIPTDSTEAFLKKIAELGTPENRSTNAEDVTEEYYDVSARIENKKELEKRILKLLEVHTGDLKDVLTVEEQLARIREEIEKMEGRINHMNDITDMTTIQVSAREERDFVPPEAPSFTTEIGDTWDQSTAAIRELGESLIIAIVSLIPWSPVAFVILFQARRIHRRRRRRQDSA